MNLSSTSVGRRSRGAFFFEGAARPTSSSWIPSKRGRGSLLAVVFCLIFGRVAWGAGPASGLFPFVLPWDDDSAGVTDLSDWLDKPAGRRGYVRVGEGGHLYAGTDRIRFLGVNMSFSGGMPEKADAVRIAGRLAKFGVNVVRFHHLDTSPWPNGILKADGHGSAELHPEAVDRLDYFIAQLKQRGIYVNLNLLVGRPFDASDGLPPEIESLGWKDRHVIGFFNARHLALQQAYARDLLARKNAYTGVGYVADPAVAFVEINNEQGLIHAWLGGKVDALPDIFQGELKLKWNAWLEQRYETTSELRRGWAPGVMAPGNERLRNPAFTNRLSEWRVERHGDANMLATVVRSVPAALRDRTPWSKGVRIRVLSQGAETWHLQFNQSGIRLEEEHPYTLSFWARADSERSISVGVGEAHEPWRDLGLSVPPRLTPEWRRFRYVFRSRRTDADARVSFSGFGKEGRQVWLAGISLRAGGLTGLREDEGPGGNGVPLFPKATFGERTSAAQRDWIRFLYDREATYWREMYRFLKEELEVKALVTGTIAGCSPVTLQAEMDWVDSHAYFNHPRFPGRPWDPEDWIVRNDTLVNEAGGALARLALWRVHGKPYACTEYNHPAPNTYGSEAFLLLAAYAAQQDWDAIYVYSYAHSRAKGWDSRKIDGFFDIDQHPLKMATLPAAAAMFVRGDVKPARREVVVPLTREKEIDLIRQANAWTLIGGANLGVDPRVPLLHRFALDLGGAEESAARLAPGMVRLSGDRYVSDSDELVWDLSTAERGLVTIHTPRTRGVIGYGGGRRVNLGGITIEADRGLQAGWSAITVVAMEGRLPESLAEKVEPARVLVTATGYTENTGMRWKSADRDSVGRDWGDAPSRVEGVSARIRVRVPRERLSVWALDERGQRQGKLSVQRITGRESAFRIGPEHRTLWYEAELR